MKKLKYLLLIFISAFLLNNNIEVSAEGPYTVQYRVWDENSQKFIYYDDKTVEHGDPAPYFEPILVGYDFVKWDVPLFSITEDTIATAEIKLKEYTVTFIDHDGTVLFEDSITYKTTIEPIENPIREGYDFIGWDSEEFEITENTTYTAMYEEIEVVVEQPTDNPDEPVIKKIKFESTELEYTWGDPLQIEVPTDILLEKITEAINYLEEGKYRIYFPTIGKGDNSGLIINIHKDSLKEAKENLVSLYVNLDEVTLILDPEDLNSILIVDEIENLYIENKNSNKEMEIIKVGSMDGTPIANQIEINVLTDNDDAFFGDIEVEYKPILSTDGLFNGYNPSTVKFVIYDEVKEDYKTLPSFYNSQTKVYTFSISKNSIIMPVELTESITVVEGTFDPLVYILGMNKSILALSGIGLFALIYGTIYVSEKLKERNY